jgi:DNA uptake protein ComE-like DNA-binding protein
MKKQELKRLVKDYFSFTRSERRGLIVLAFLLMVSIVLFHYADRFNVQKPISETEKKQFLEWAKQQQYPEPFKKVSLFRFNPNTVGEAELDSLGIPANIINNLMRYRSKGGVFKKPEDFRKLYGMTDTIYRWLLPYITIPYGKSQTLTTPGQETRLFKFDPNVVSEDELSILGFNSFQKNNLLRFRKSGGRFLNKTDLLKIYGVDSAFYDQMKDFLLLEEKQDPSSERMEELHIELNQADSSSLVQLPGIGTYFAGRIVRYRNILGGFYSIRQLMEVYGMSEDKFAKIQHFIYTDTSFIQPVRINFADERSLDRHPYINRQQATNIIKLRSAQGAFQRSDELFTKGIFDKAAYENIKPYITCR